MQLNGFHHLTAITADAPGNLDFYTRVLGLRLVKKTVNQDDVSAYHLFYADARGTPGTDITFFDWPSPPERRGTRSIVRTGFRVPRPESLRYWAARLKEMKVTPIELTERNGRSMIDFEDPEGQRLSFVADEFPAEAQPWDQSPVPPGHQLCGLGPVFLSVPRLDATEAVLTQVMGMRRQGEYAGHGSEESTRVPRVYVFESGAPGPAGELHVAVEPHLPQARHGAGGVHHVAFRVPTFEQYEQWTQRLRDLGVPNSGPVDRFYFRSLYFREPGGILFELATDGPGFTADEPADQLGGRLALPPFLEPRRREIEAGLKPL